MINKSEDKTHPLSALWMQKILAGGSITTTDLIPYSKVKISKVRMLKKFLKNPYRYISNKTHEIWLGCLVGNFTVKTFMNSFNFNLDVEPMEPKLNERIPEPEGKLVYIDYQYKNETNEENRTS